MMSAVVVRAKPGEKVDQLIRRFQKKVAEEKLLEEFREKERYQKPSELRKQQRYRLERMLELAKKSKSST